MVNKRVTTRPQMNNLFEALATHGTVSVVTTTKNSKKIVTQIFDNLNKSTFTTVIAPNYLYPNVESARKFGYYNVQSLLALIAKIGRSERGVGAKVHASPGKNSKSQLFVISSEQVSYYDYIITKFVGQFKLHLLCIGPNYAFGHLFNFYGEKLRNIYSRNSKYVTITENDIIEAINIENKKSRGTKILYLVSDAEKIDAVKKILYEEYRDRYFIGTFVFPDRSKNFILISVKISNAVLEVAPFDYIFVDATVEFENVGIGAGEVTNIIHPLRSNTEYDILASLGRQLIILADGYDIADTPEASAIEKFTLDDCTTILCKNGLFADYPTFITENKYILASVDKLHKLGMIDSKYRVTDIGDLSQFYSWNACAGLFLYYWVHGGEELFPGVVIAAFLEQLQVFEYSNGEKVTNTLDTYLWAWHDLVANVKGQVLDSKSKPVKNWIRENITSGGASFTKLVQLVAKKSRDLKVTFFGQFHVDQAIIKVLPIFEKVYNLWSGNSVEMGYEMINGQVYASEINTDPRLAILKVADDKVLVSLPLEEPVKQAEEEEEELDLPNLNVNTAKQKWQSKTIGIMDLPIEQLID